MQGWTLDELAALPAGVVPVAGPVDVVGLEARCDARGRPMVLLDTASVTDKPHQITFTYIPPLNRSSHTGTAKWRLERQFKYDEQ